MREMDVVVQKLIYHNKESAYSVFSGTVLRWSSRKQDYLPTRETQTFVGYFFCIFPGDRFHLEANEVFNKDYGTQYLVSKSNRKEPATLIEIKTFLLKNVKGMTPKRLEKVIDKYGLDAIQALRNDAKAYDFLKIPQKDLDEIRNAILTNESFEDILAYLQMHHIDCRYAYDLHQQYGENARTTLNQNPYIPYLDGIFEFNLADSLYCSLGYDQCAIKRCLYTVLAALRRDSGNGSVFTRRIDLKDRMIGVLPVLGEGGFPFEDKMLDDSINMLEISKHIVVENKEDLYLGRNYFDEKKVSSCLHGFMTEPKRLFYRTIDINAFLSRYQKQTGLTFAPEQIDAVHNALTSPLSIISGGPGTGKTQTINTIIAAIRDMTPDAIIRACAPTGKAAIRVSELTNVPASTIHSMLKIGTYDQMVKGGDLVCDFMFVDEFSMVDINLCADLFDAVNTCGRIIIVGDYNQLPSVGPGLVLRDLIASGCVPKTILTQIFRQKDGSRIIDNAHRVINQIPGQSVHFRVAKKPGEDFYFIEEEDPKKIIETIKRSIAKLQKTYGYNSDAIQVLSPVKFGDLGTQFLNYELQRTLNHSPHQIEFENKVFALGDKVTHIKNDYNLKVFNGEVGYVSDISFTKKNALRVSYPDRDIIYPYSKLEELDLAYALTVHKLQGSEYPVIIMPVHSLQGQGLSKNLIYTALTRAKQMVILIGDPQSFSSGLRRETTMQRESNLIDRIQSILPII